MREIKFRGKATREIKEKRDDGFLYSDNCDNGVKSTESLQRIAFFWDYVACGYIDPATVGQWTGLKDSNGVEIYEGELVVPEHYQKRSDKRCEVMFACGMFCLKPDGKFITEVKPLFQTMINAAGASNAFVVIGNIHEVKNDQS